MEVQRVGVKGIPLRVEIGPRDLASNTVVLVRRDTGAKQSMPMDSIAGSVAKILDEISKCAVAKSPRSSEGPNEVRIRFAFNV